MLVKLRLQRLGRKKLPFYRIVAASSSAKRDGKFLQIIGIYHPTVEDPAKQIRLEEDKTRYWLENGAQSTQTVKKLLSKIGFWQEFTQTKQQKLLDKVKNQKTKPKKAKKGKKNPFKAKAGKKT